MTFNTAAACLIPPLPALATFTNSVMAVLPQSVSVFTPEGRLVFVNAAARAMIPGGVAHWEALHWGDLWPLASRAELAAAVASAIRDGAGRLTTSHTSAGGERRVVDLAIVPVRRDDGAFDPLHGVRDGVTHLVFTAHDVTAHHDTAAGLQADLSQREDALSVLACQVVDETRRLNEMRDRVLQGGKAKLLGDFVGNIVHDINNVLTIMQASTTLLLRQAGPGVRPGIAAAANDALARGATLVRQLLDFARQDHVIVTAPPSKILRDNASMLGALVGEGITVEIPPLTVEWPLTLRSGALESVLFNLAANARDAMPGGGTLRFDAANVGPGDTPAALPPGEYVRIRVTDTGQGMTPEVLARAGQPFFTTKARGAGTGLGLASAFDLAEGQGGCVTINSVPGKGTAIDLYLSRAGIRPPVTGSADVAGRLHGDATILLVDRTETTRTALAEGLRALRYTVLEASSNEMALGLALSDVSVDLLVHDMDTGTQSGFTLVEELRRRSPGLPVITLCGASEPDPPLAGVWVRKPVYPPLLARTVAEQLGRLPAVLMTPALLQASEKLRTRLTNPAMADLFDMWHGVSRALGRLPSLTELPALVGAERVQGPYLVEQLEEPGQFRIAWICSSLSEAPGLDLAGKIVGPTEDTMLGSQQQAYLRCTRGVAFYDYARIRLNEQASTLFQRLLLPLSTNGRGVTHLLGMVSVNDGGRAR